jgi:hypothetical protein
MNKDMVGLYKPSEGFIEKIDPNEEILKSLFNERFVGISQTVNVWGNLFENIEVPESLVQEVAQFKKTQLTDWYLFYDPGLSLEDIHSKFGQEAFTEEFDEIFSQLYPTKKTRNKARDASWVFLNRGRDNQTQLKSSEDTMQVLYGLLMFFFLYQKSLNDGCYWIRTDTYSSGGSSLALSMQDNGLLRATGISG